MSETNQTTQTTATETATTAVAKAQPVNVVVNDVYGSSEEMATAWRMAKMLASSSLIPDNFKNHPEDCMLAIDMAKRLNMPPFSVLQEIFVVHGKPSFSSKFLIGCVNSCGRFTPLTFKKGEKGGIIAFAKSKATGETLESPEVTIEMATAEGWTSKSGSKWKTMPDLMARYRAATFFARLYCPDVTFGIKTTDEIADIDASRAFDATSNAVTAFDGGNPSNSTPDGKAPVKRANYSVMD